MTKERAWPTKAMYILIAAALAISLMIMVAPAQKVSAAPDEVKAEWDMVDTPTYANFLIADESVIYDYALASEGDVAYAVVWAYPDTCDEEDIDTYRLLKSDTGAATWTDLTDTLVDQLDDDGYNLTAILQVATDWIDPDFLAVALVVNGTVTDTPVHVYISADGGDTFIDTGEVEDDGAYLSGANYGISDLAVSPAVDDAREIAIGGAASGTMYGTAGIFRCTVTGDNPSSWTDATTYSGWNDSGDFTSFRVTDVIFSPNWATDATILVVTYGPTGPGLWDVYLQSGAWGKTTGAWNTDAGFADAVLVKEDVGLPTFLRSIDARGIAGVALPDDYEGDDSTARYAWVWVNYYDGDGDETGEIVMVNDSLATPINQQIAGMPWLTNVSYLGTIAQGKAIAGVLGDGAGDITDCCEGIRVYHNNTVAHMNICCEPWEIACKLPTGRFAMAVSYVDANNAGDSQPDKAYAVALDGFEDYDEGAWSVSVDGDGLVWNQLSLIDTYIDYLSDVAVSPDCNKMMLVSVNLDAGCGCDSVWLKAENLPEAEEYSGYWIRTWCGQLMGLNSDDFPRVDQRGLLRLAPEETTGDTVYLFDRMTDTIYYNDMETWDCWKQGTAPFEDIVDLAVLDEATIYALAADGDVAMSDDHGKAITWTDPVDSELDAGWTIAVHDDWVLVGGQDGDVSYSDDGGETFTALDKVVDDENVYVTVAFDTYFDTNEVVYAALAHAYEDNGIYSTTIPDNESWTNLGAEPYNYRGLVLSYPDGNPFTSADTGGVIYASYFTYEPEYTDNCDYCGCEDARDDLISDLDGDYECWHSGVARSLTPITEEAVCPTCETSQWDYLTWGLDYDVSFIMTPNTLKACGCLTPDTNTKLFAIDGPNPDEFDEAGFYDLCEGEQGTVWTFEDCYAKKAVELVSPADGYVVGTSTCGCCNIPFNINWDRLCDACCYEIQFALDADFTQIVNPYPIEDGDVPDFGCYCPADEIGASAAANPIAYLGCFFLPETTYYWRVRATQAGTCQEIHSWWSDAQSFTVAPTAEAGAINLVAPVPGATDVGIKNVGFSWNTLADVDSYDWTLSPNADLSAPLGTETVTGTATTYTGTLTYGTTYYWQVTAYKEGSPISTSPIGTFTTTPHGAFCSAIDGACFDTQAQLDAHNAELNKPAGTPFWVWVVIGIGAVLVIVVIVLIFRTRRV